YKGRETATEVITQAVDRQLENTDDDYIDILRDPDGNITSVQINTQAVNQLQNNIKTSINDALSEIDDKELSVPLGTLSGITFFSGRGSDVTLKLHQVGAVDTEIISEFTSAGVNQTKHRISVVVTAEISAILPLHSTDITVCNEYLICETVIVGKVPEVYLKND
ncbi:MAG: sporulation protein YunB, partial [Oscillospiraceae bacterium]